MTTRKPHITATIQLWGHDFTAHGWLGAEDRSVGIMGPWVDDFDVVGVEYDALDESAIVLIEDQLLRAFDDAEATYWSKIEADLERPVP